ncbi:hypothetical protein ACWGQL_30110 [Streptomyces lydicus]
MTVWDFSGRGPAGTSPPQLRAHRRITALAWRPGAGAQLATGGSEGSIALWHAATGLPGGVLNPARTVRLPAPVAALAWSGPRLLVTADHEGNVVAHRLPDGNTR